MEYMKKRNGSSRNTWLHLNSDSTISDCATSMVGNFFSSQVVFKLQNLTFPLLTSVAALARSSLNNFRLFAWSWRSMSESGTLVPMLMNTLRAYRDSVVVWI